MARLDTLGHFFLFRCMDHIMMSETSAAVAGPTDAAATPLPRGGRSDSTARTVTCEKIAVSSHGGPRSGGGEAVVVFSVSCPDGSVVRLSAPARDGTDGSRNESGGAVVAAAAAAGTGFVTNMILGRGRFGIPSSALHVSRRACVLRVVASDRADEGEGKDGARNAHPHYGLELVVIGSRPCRVSPCSSSLSSSSSSDDSFFLRSISQILGHGDDDRDDTSPSVVYIRDGDVVEPYERPTDCAVSEAVANGVHYPFTIRIATSRANIAQSPTGGVGLEEDGDAIDGPSFAEASRMIDMAVAIPPPRQEWKDSQETVDAPASIEPERETATEMLAADNATDDGEDGTREALVLSELMDDRATGKIDDDMKESASEEVIKTAKKNEYTSRS